MNKKIIKWMLVLIMILLVLNISIAAEDDIKPTVTDSISYDTTTVDSTKEVVKGKTDEEVNKIFMNQINSVKGRDDIDSFIGILIYGNQILEKNKELKAANKEEYKIFDSTKEALQEKYNMLEDTGMIPPGIPRTLRTGVLSSSGGGTGATTKWSLIGIIAVLILIIGYMKFKGKNLKKQYKKIAKFQKTALSLAHKEELNKKHIEQIEETKEKLIKENLEKAKTWGEQKEKFDRLDPLVRKNTPFEGIFDERLKHLTPVQLSNYDNIGTANAKEIMEIADAGEKSLVENQIKNILKKIRHENLKLDRLIVKEFILDKEVIEELTKGERTLQVSENELIKIKEFIKRNDGKLRGVDRKSLGIIQKEKDVESIIREGKDVAKKTLIAIHEFKKLTERFEEFTNVIKKQNLSIKSEEQGLKQGDGGKVENSSQEISYYFETEKKFYAYIKQKEEESGIEVLKAFGNMEDITILTAVTDRMSKIVIGLGDTELVINKSYEELNRLKYLIQQGRMDPSQVRNVEKIQQELDQLKEDTYKEGEKTKQVEILIHLVIERMGDLSKMEDERSIEKEKHETGDMIHQSEKHSHQLESETNSIKKTGSDIINKIKSIWKKVTRQ